MEKALKARQEGSNPNAGFLAPTKAFEIQAQTAPLAIMKKKLQEQQITEEEQVKMDEERREQVAAIRRKFKEKNRNILLSLMNKNKEIEKKVRIFF